MNRIIISLCVLLGGFSPLFAQAPVSTFKTAPREAAFTAAARHEMPTQYTVFQADFAALELALRQAPRENSSEAMAKNFIVELPAANGGQIAYAVWQTDVMHPELGARYPEIRTYAGMSTSHPGRVAHFTVSPRGLEAAVRCPDGSTEYLEPWTPYQTEGYLAYNVKNVPAAADRVRCGVEDEGIDPTHVHEQPLAAQPRGSAAPVSLRTYRFACATTGHFAQDVGNTVAQVLSVVVDRVNKINLIYEIDHAIRLQLIPTNDQIIFMDPDTDPYSGNQLGDWMGQNPGAINPIIGSSNYDVGHVFGRYFTGSATGIAALSSGCTQLKGRGASAANLPYGQYFVRVAAHEVGHQLSATHIFNSCTGSEGNRTGSSAFEPGSGSTIMSYAGACGPDNIQGDSDDYFNVFNIEQIRTFTTTGDGGTCGTLSDAGNTSPNVSSLVPANLSIPIGTPFLLRGAGTDADGDPLTFCWEQQDLGVEVNLGQTGFGAPLFRSRAPVGSPDRSLPTINTLITNSSSDVEILPMETRQLNFRLTARDNRPGGGGLEWTDLKIFTTAQAGPFTVTTPNTSGVVWRVGEYQTVTWDVANTDKAPVNCQTVTIKLSINAGLLFNITLAENVPNTGSACIFVPNNPSNSCRIRVEAADNIFFDISNVNFRILQPAQAAFGLCASKFADQACLPQPYTLPISTSSLLGFSTPIQMEATGLPAGVQATFTPNPVQPGQTTTMQLNFDPGFSETTFSININGTADGVTQTSPLELTSVNNNFAAFALTAPANGAVGVEETPTLHWVDVPDANVYEVQIATNPSFEAATLVASSTSVSVDSFDTPVLLEKGKVYFWRVRPVNECGAGAWSEPFVFATQILSCTSYTANDLPKNIPTTAGAIVESKITVIGGGVISDANVAKVRGSHTWFNDLEVNLISPAGTSVLLWKNRCAGTNAQFNMGFDDSAPAVFSCPPPNNGTASKAAASLSAFNGQNSAGQWTLRVKDNNSPNGGQLQEFQLELCSSVALDPPVLENNNPLSLPAGTNAPIEAALLKATDPNNGPNQLVFTLLTVPQKGELQKNWTGALKPGDQFTQADINAGAIRYFHYGLPGGDDSFRFSVTDGEGGLVAGTFTIANPVRAFEPAERLAFELAPNPASSSVRLTFPEALGADTRVALFNSAGQRLRNWNLGAGAFTQVLDLVGLPEGVYIVTVENERSAGVRKLIVRSF